MAGELLTVAQMGQADALTMASGTPGIALMRRAGQSVCDAIQARWSPRPTVVLCGPGNNGGDGWVVASLLQQAGWPVTLSSLVPRDQLRGDARLAGAEWTGAVEPLTVSVLDGAALVVDALFGAGLTRPLEGQPAAVLAEAQRRGLPVVAVDVPSGVWGDTGAVTGAVASALTVTFFRAKPGHVLMPGRSLCGELVVADIGLPDAVLTQLCVQAWDNQPALWCAAWPTPASGGHKYHRGHAVVWGGARMTGAPRLAARAAARIGAGLTTVCVPESAWAIYAAALDSIMVHAVKDAPDVGLAALLADSRHRAVLVGPGALGGHDGAGVRALVHAALVSGRAVVLDADALTAFEHDADALRAAIGALPERPVVLTPHEGEFARLMGDRIKPGLDKLTRARALAAWTGATVLLKGPDTVVASPDGRASINRHAPATLATAGAGDVLAGLILGLLAQGMPAWEAASAAVWVHGDAAHAFGPGLIADDLPEAVPGVLRRLADRR
jgi:NAD(P)H-hydrate epimerase